MTDKVKQEDEDASEYEVVDHAVTASPTVVAPPADCQIRAVLRYVPGPSDIGAVAHRPGYAEARGV